MNDDDFPSGLAGFLVAALLIAGFVVGAVRCAKFDNFCLAHGYPHSQWNVTAPNYCVKRVDQTDVVVPEADVRKVAR